jgi:hypothetical protein
MTPRARARSPSVLLLVLLIVALGVGAAASALTTIAPAPTGTGTGVTVPTQLIVGGVFVLAVAAAGLLLYHRLTQPSLSVPGRFLAAPLVAILLLILFVVVVHLVVVGAGPGGTISTAPPTNSTTGTNSSLNGTLNATGAGGAPPLWSGFPSWTLFAVVAVAVAVVAVVAIPELRALLAGRRPGSADVDLAAAAAGARAALGDAQDQLDRGGDPRAVIVALYASLLLRLGPMVGDLDPATPEEIRSKHLVRLGIQPLAAHALTRLFEEARYSSHPMDAAAAARARVILRAAEADLARPAPAV